MKNDNRAHECKNSHPLVLDQFWNSWTFEGSIGKKVACPASVHHVIIWGWTCITRPTIADTWPISIWHAKSIWKWDLSIVTYSCTARLRFASSAVCRVVRQAWKSAIAASWRVAGCAVPWLSCIRGTIVLSCNSALGTYLGWSRHICKCFITSRRWWETTDAYSPRQERVCIWIFKCCTTIIWSARVCWIWITLESCCASSWRTAGSTIPSFGSISSAGWHCD